ncbi:sulfonate transport system ATP-binding protein [Verrucomicrobium sp. GAS474]|uniref:ABC transporter ATP-binding protein n=1 Tax=Verrucomicrobium sp. GAS474 TaxID=1882831 RepID=UPI00087CD54F|nr:ATP-binding cassette domain-containing protein [Verrucomicrobium sp. GAS474]SDT93592.1 sulfonate transport system ATP-binding protein [Verrucomicrobium sp. GAS474]
MSAPSPSSPNGLRLEVSHVTKRFGANTVLHDLSFTAEPGEFLAIVGKSGSGKSTLLRLLSGLDTPDAGTLLADGRPIGLNGPSNRDTLVLFQDSRLLPWKRVVDNVGLGLDGTKGWKETAEAMLRHVGLDAKSGEWPALLSGGQRQRVALARALIRQPRLMLFDEPLGALDALTRLDMQGLIEGLWAEQRFTSVFITHDVEEAVALADRVLLLEVGRIVLDRKVALSRPRLRTNPVFSELKAEILDAVMHREEAKAGFAFSV